MNYLHTKEEFEKFIRNNNNVIIDFYADWCGPCKLLAPIFEELSNEKKNVTFAKVNVDESLELAELFGIMSIPNMIYIKNQKKVLNEVGFKTKEAILENIKTIYE